MEEFRKVHPNGDTYCSKCKHDRSVKARKENPEKTKKYEKVSSLRRMYGIELSEYNKMLKEQEGSCAICKSKPNTRMLHVDHCHSLGNIRGLLCHGCNTGLGLFKDNKGLLMSAIKYLAKKSKKKGKK